MNKSEHRSPSTGSASTGWSALPLTWKLWRRRAFLRQRSQRIASAVDGIPNSVQEHWLAHAASEVPGWRPNRTDWLIAAGALLQFFECCRQKTTALPCALPSRAADSVWHLWLANEPESLDAFQRREYGQIIPHVEAPDLGADLESALAQSWAMACRSESLSPLGRTAPLMFAADGILGTPGGWAYNFGIFENQIVHHDLGDDGRPVPGLHHHAGLTAASWVGLGLLGEHELSLAKRRRESDDGGAGFLINGNSVSADAGHCHDAGSHGGGTDGGCSGGSSCGSSCGSGSSCGGGH